MVNALGKDVDQAVFCEFCEDASVNVIGECGGVFDDACK